MKPQTFIFTGRSGVGKGTQAALLIEYLKKKDTKKVLYFASGDGLREYIKGTKHSHKLAKQIYDTGGLFPEFLAVHNWSHFFSENMEGDEHVILDGLPRKLCEAQILDTAFDFYEHENVFIIWMEGSRDWSTKLLSSRGRSDDTPENIVHRLDWYDEEVAPTIEYYRRHPRHIFLEINAEQPIEDVHNEIVQKIEAAA
ncbi:MAG TPA: nucleoside monophosphate kinase [Candidatus Paceibacterota bacterium]